jgi:hypothetical protein
VIWLQNAVLNLIGHAEPVSSSDMIRFQEQCDGVVELLAVEGNGPALFEANRDLFALDRDIVAPECRAHDWDNDLDGRREMLQILGFMGRAENVGVCGVGFFR